MAKDADSSSDRFDEAFVQLLGAEQIRLLRYITMLLGDMHAADNVLQETNLTLWRKANEFQIGTNFSAWARQIAYWKALSYVRDRQRDRHVFSEAIVQELANRTVSETDDTEVRLALRHCLEHLSPAKLELLRKHYREGRSIAVMAEQMGKTPSAVKVGLLRIRRALMKCIQQKLANC